MAIVLIGMSHKTAPVEVRELLAFSETQIAEILQLVVDRRTISESLVISTCNRVEIIVVAPQDREAHAAVSHIFEVLGKYRSAATDLLSRYSYTHIDLEAIKHIFRVTASLDSMVVGEPQITGQVKEAFQLAQQAQSVGHSLTRLMNRAFFVSKRVRNETGIGSSAVSISYIAVELAKKVFETLRGARVMLIGAGEMAELAAKHLISNGATDLLIINRTFESAKLLAEAMNGEPVPFDELGTRLPDADVVICSTGADRFIVNRDQVTGALEVRRNHPMLLIDISVPRNIDPGIGDLDNAFIFDIDDMEAISGSNRSEREREALGAESIIEQEAARFFAAQSEGDLNAVIGAFRREAGAIALSELEKSRKRLGDLTEEQEETLMVMINAIVNRFTQPVIKQLRESEDGHSTYLEAWGEIYHRFKEKK